MSPERPLDSKLKTLMKHSQSNDSISTSPASSREGSVEGARAGVQVRALRDEPSFDDTASEGSTAREMSPGKIPPRARKSFPKSPLPNGKEERKAKTTPNNVTFKIADLSSKLGLQGESLANVDAKTLDQLLLKAKKDTLKEGSRGGSPAPLTKDSPSVQRIVEVEEPSEEGAVTDEAGTEEEIAESDMGQESKPGSTVKIKRKKKENLEPTACHRSKSLEEEEAPAALVQCATLHQSQRQFSDIVARGVHRKGRRRHFIFCRAPAQLSTQW